MESVPSFEFLLKFMKNTSRNSSLQLILFLVLWYIHIVVLVSASEESKPPQYVPKEIFDINCQGSTAADDLPIVEKWGSSHFNRSKLNAKRVTKSSIESTQGLRHQLHACIYQQRSSVPLPVTSPGMKFIRLYFYPTSYNGLKISKALFSVSVGNYNLLNISDSSSWNSASDKMYTVKEFCVHVDGIDPVPSITFAPSENSPGAYGFVNKIEVVSMPQNLYLRGGVPLPLVGNHSKYFVTNSGALETISRLNVGGDWIAPEADSGLYRIWAEDAPYLIDHGEFCSAEIRSKGELTYGSSVPTYTAPAQVYNTARTTNHKSYCNLAWLFPLDSGFFYLVRLHFYFCESDGGVPRANQRAFQIYMNNQMVEDHVDVFQWSNGSGVPVYKDYAVDFSEYNLDMQNLTVIIRGEDNGYAFLNGLEIFKLSDSRNNLAGPNPFRNTNLQLKKPPENEKKINRIAHAFGIVFLAVTLVSCFYLYFETLFLSSFVSLLKPWFKSRRKASIKLGSMGHCHYFSLTEIKHATNNFSDHNLIGAGGFGKVYKGCFDGSAAFVAIKRGNPTSHQGLHEFQTEIIMLSKLRHCNLVSLIGCSTDEKEMILVYDFMAQGTLRSHLYHTPKPPLPWGQRLKICIDTARGLHYLHAGTKQMIIHRDVKTTNILLDKGLVAKVADFGLSKVGPMSQTHVSTAVKGSFGYLDPEYYRRQQLTEKSDVYSFGVVLMEVLCARPAVLPVVEEEEEEEDGLKQVNLAEWALHCHQMGSLDQIIDPYLRGRIDHECFKTFTETAMKCLADKGSERPRMGDVLRNLELAWHQQQQQQREAVDHAEEEERRCSETNTIIGGEVVVTIDGLCPGIGNSDLTPGAEFSELRDLIGR